MAGLGFVAGKVGGLAMLGVVGGVGVDEAGVQREVVVAGDDEFAGCVVSELNCLWSLKMLYEIFYWYVVMLSSWMA